MLTNHPNKNAAIKSSSAVRVANAQNKLCHSVGSRGQKCGQFSVSGGLESASKTRTHRVKVPYPNPHAPTADGFTADVENNVHVLV